MFTRYIRHLLYSLSNCGVGCNIGGLAVNIIAYADDTVLLAPSWRALQALIVILEKCCISLDLVCNTKKTVCMVFDPWAKDKIICKHFPNFSLGRQPLQFVTEFRYIGHIISNTLTDDSDICREIQYVICVLEICLSVGLTSVLH